MGGVDGIDGTDRLALQAWRQTVKGRRLGADKHVESRHGKGNVLAGIDACGQFQAQLAEGEFENYGDHYPGSQGRQRGIHPVGHIAVEDLDYKQGRGQRQKIGEEGRRHQLDGDERTGGKAGKQFLHRRPSFRYRSAGIPAARPSIMGRGEFA